MKSRNSTKDQRLKFEDGLVTATRYLGCNVCEDATATIRDAFYDGQTWYLTWSPGEPFTAYIARLQETQLTKADIEEKIKAYYIEHSGLSGLLDDADIFFEGVHRPDYGNLLHWGGAATLGGTQNISIKITGIHEDCETGKVNCIYELGIGDMFGAGITDGSRWLLAGLISQFILQHFRNGECPDGFTSSVCYTPMEHWVEILGGFSFETQ